MTNPLSLGIFSQLAAARDKRAMREQAAQQKQEMLEDRLAQQEQRGAMMKSRTLEDALKQGQIDRMNAPVADEWDRFETDQGYVEQNKRTRETRPVTFEGRVAQPYRATKDPRLTTGVGPDGKPTRVVDEPGVRVPEPVKDPNLTPTVGPDGKPVWGPKVAGGEIPQTGSQPSQRQQATYKKDALTIANMKDAIQRYREVLAGTGVEVNPFGAQKALLTGAHANVMLQGKEIAKLGVLAGPDMGILEKLVNDPTSVKSMATNVFGTRANALQKQLDQYEAMIDQMKDRLEQTYGGDDTENDPLATWLAAQRAKAKKPPTP